MNKQTVVITTTLKKIIIKTPGPFAKEALKEAGCRWLGAPHYCWWAPRSAAMASRIIGHLSTFEIQYTVESADFDDLLEEFKERGKVQGVKVATELSPPPIRKTEPWLHQLQGYHFAMALQACMLAMDMGTGKTKTTIDVCQNTPGHDGPPIFLILCPRYVVGVWPRELKKHCAIRYEVSAPEGVSVPKRVERIAKAMDMAKVKGVACFVVINYESVLSPAMNEFLLSFTWDATICDESHRIKSPTGKTSRIIRTKIALKSIKRIELTGTPMPNTPLDIWAQFYFLDPGIFGSSFARFRKQYALCDQFKQPFRFINTEEMNESIYSMAFRVSADILDLPPRHRVVHSVKFEPYAQGVYNQLKKVLVAELRTGTLSAANGAVKLLRLQQITSGHAPTDESDFTKKEIVSTAKADLLGEVLSDMKKEEPVVIFCRFIHDLNEIRRIAEAQGRRCAEVSGRMKDQSDFVKWQNGEADILVAQIQSAKEGIDCSRARYGIYYSLGFSPGDYDQSERRIWRPGQERSVTYFHLVVEGTVDEYVHSAIVKKRNIINTILEEHLEGIE